MIRHSYVMLACVYITIRSIGTWTVGAGFLSYSFLAADIIGWRITCAGHRVILLALPLLKDLHTDGREAPGASYES